MTISAETMPTRSRLKRSHAECQTPSLRSFSTGAVRTAVFIEPP